MSFPSQHLPARRFAMPGAALLLLCCLPLSALANVELPNGAFHETVADLSVKVAGGWASLLRTWYDRARDLGGETPTLSATGTGGGGSSSGGLIWNGTAAGIGYQGEWAFNRAWADLFIPRTSTVLGSGSSGATDPSLGSDGTPIPSLWRNGDRYDYREGAETPLWAFGARAWIERTEQGYRWHNRRGDWIDYDADGRMSAYGDANGVTVRVERNAEHHIQTIRDRYGRAALSIDYDADGYPVELRDNRTPEPRRVLYHWDNGLLTRVTDVLGRAWRYAYDADEQLIRLTDPDGHSRHITYHETGQTASVKDDQGQGVEYAYDYDRTKKQYYVRQDWTDGRIIETWYDQHGRVLRRDINSETQRRLVQDGRRTQIHFNARGNATTRIYDEWENLTRITYADGATETTRYDYRFHLPKEHIDALGRHTLYEYDDRGNLTRLTEAAGTADERISEITWDADGNPVELRRLGDAKTAETIISGEYDDYGNLITLTGPEGGVTRFTHDNQGKVLTRTDPNQHTWTYTYNRRGRLASVTDPEDHTVSLHYSALGQLDRLTDAREHSVELTYDPLGRRITVTDREDHTSQLVYDELRRRLRLTDALNNTEQLDYDLAGHLTGYTDQADDAISFGYALADGQGGGTSGDTRYPGLINRIQYPSFLQTFDYDRRDRLTAVITHLSDTDKQITHIAYDPVGNRTATTDALNRTTHCRYDALNRLVEIIDPAQQSTTFSYDHRDNLLSVTDPNGHTTTYRYDKADRQIAETGPGGETWTYEYDPAGQLTASIDPDGRRTENDYDKAGQLIAQRHSAPGQSEPERSLAYSYDPNGNLASWSDGTTHAHYTYDKNDRLLSETTHYAPFSLSHAYSYDAAGHKQTYTGPGETAITYHWDKGRLARIELPGQGSISVNSYHWSKPEQITYPGGTRRTFGYDPLMRPTHIQVQDPAELTVMDYRYQYDAVGNITDKGTEHGDYHYQYDEMDRLIEAKSPSEIEGWQYDPNGNRIQDALNPGTWRYDENDQLIESPFGTYRYDAAGNTIERTEGEQTKHPIYNAEGRLVRVEDQAGSLIGQYRYDPFGRRISKTAAEGTRYFHYTDEGLAGEYGPTGTPIRRYGYWPDSTWTTDPLYQKGPQGYGFYQNDHLGTPQRVMTPNGATVWQGRYRAFGELTQESGEWGNPLRFPGQYAEPETGWYYNYFRDYDPSTGRYLESDPIGLGGGLNTYSYAAGDPVAFTDPNGLFICGGACLAAIAGGYALVEFAMSAWDAYDTYQTLADDCASLREKTLGAGLFLAGVVGPGGGYGKIDDLAEWAAKSRPRDALGRFTTGAGGDSVEAAAGRRAHEAFDEAVKSKPGWQSKPRIIDADGNAHIPDALSPSGRPVEFKPNTASGRKQGRRQLKRYERVTGRKGRVIYYDVN